jgi:hypothetical protein
MIKNVYLRGRSFVNSRDWIRLKRLLSLSAFFYIFLFTVQSVIVQAQSEGESCESGSNICWASQESFEELSAIKTSKFPPSEDAISAGLTQDGMLITKGFIYLGGATALQPFAGALPNDNVSTFSKNGLYGITQEAMFATLYMSPSVNVYEHIAQDWVPGNQTNTSVYASESGYDVLVNSGIAPLWEKTRNIAYLLFVLVLIVAGFMIMFRQKIGGQTAVTVMNTIPNVLVSLILVTFSFAIVGILMNIGGLLINVSIGVLDLNPGEVIYTDGIWSIVEHFFKGGVVGGDGAAIAGAGATGGVVGGLAAWGSASLPATIAGSAGAAAAATAALGVVVVVGVLAGLIALAIIGVIAWASFKVFLTLVKAYIGLLFDTIMAPIFLALSAIPGRETMRADWFRRVMKNILIFPVVFMIVNFGTFIFQSGLNIGLPGVLTGGSDYAGIAPDSILMGVITRIVIIYLYFLAAQAPKLLEEFLPQSGGKSIGDALKGAASSVPLIGGMFG